MEFGHIYSGLKVSRVVPEYKKKGDKRDVKNYRITAISSTIMRIYESAIKLKLVEIVDPQITNAQHGFRPKRSVETNMLNLSIFVHDAFVKKQQVDIFYGDFANAFDKVWHRRLIVKMKDFNIGKRTAKWLFEFVHERKFFVTMGKYESRIYEATSGVPAGSILGPTLFLISINDIVECVAHAFVLLFADDIKMAVAVSSIEDTRFLQIDINSICEWSKINRLPFNQQKCEVITVKRRNQFSEAVYKMDEHIVERKSEVRDLGIPINPMYHFGAHIERTTTKANQMMGYIKSISKGQFGTRALKVLYVAYVRSNLEFASVIWDPYQTTYSDHIESVQKKFVMFALGDTNRIPPFRLLPYKERCEKIGLETLETRRKIANLMMAYDLYNNLINDDNIQRKLIRMTPAYNFRENRVFKELTYENDCGYYQPIARVIRLANEYKDLMMTLNRPRFKTEIKKILKERDNDL